MAENVGGKQDSGEQPRRAVPQQEEVWEATGEDTGALVSSLSHTTFITWILSRCLQAQEQGCKYVSVGLKRQKVPTFFKVSLLYCQRKAMVAQ